MRRPDAIIVISPVGKSDTFVLINEARLAQLKAQKRLEMAVTDGREETLDAIQLTLSLPQTSAETSAPLRSLSLRG